MSTITPQPSLGLGDTLEAVQLEQILDVTDPNQVTVLDSVSISNKDELRDKIHSIHNFLRNHGAGYGMNALKVFNIVYGLYKIEKNHLFEKFHLDDVCRYSTLLEHAVQATANNNANGDRDALHSKFFGHGEYKESGGVLDILYEHPQLRNILFYEIPKNMTADTLVQLFKEIKSLEEVENRSNVQLAGKIYEYFIGRDNTAISELGAYFTDRYITEFIFREVAPVRLNDDGTVTELVDPFGGSGGFTISYAREIIRQSQARAIPINWKTQLRKIHHYDMNEDVIRSAALELLCMTGSLPVVSNREDSNGNEAHMGYKNSFKDEFKDRKFPLIYTNPPYGGDSSKGTGNIDKRNKLIKYLTSQLKDKTVEFSDECRQAKNRQIKQLKLDNERDVKEQKSNCVSLDTSSKRVQHYAKHYGGFEPPPMQTKSKKKPSGLTGKDKEAVSLIMLMDMLAPSGTAVGVLKDGVFFDGKYKTLRAQLLTNYNVREVVSVPKNAFENTATKTSILVFDAAPEGKIICTDTVRFSEIVVEKYTEDKITELADGTVYLEEAEGDVCNISRQDITEASYAQIATQNVWALDAKYYPKEETVLKAKEGWEMVALGDVCEIHSGKFLSSDSKQDGLYPFYSGKADNPSGRSDEFCFEFAHNYLIFVHSGGSGRGNYGDNIGLGQVFLENGRTSASSSCFALDLKKDDPQMIYYLLQMLRREIMDLANYSTGLGHITRGPFKAFKIPLPKTKSLRTHWTTRVSTPYTAKQNAEKRIVEVEATVRGMVKEVVEMEGGCEWVALGEVCEIKNGKQLSKRDCKPGNVPVIGGGKEPTAMHNESNVPANAILCSQVGNAGYISRYGVPVWASRCYGIWSKATHVKDDYLYATLKMQETELIGIQQKGSTLNHIHFGALKAFKIPLPKDPSFQTQLQPHFDELDTLRQQVKTHEAEYKQAMVELREAALEEQTA